MLRPCRGAFAVIPTTQLVQTQQIEYTLSSIGLSRCTPTRTAHLWERSSNSGAAIATPLDIKDHNVQWGVPSLASPQLPVLKSSVPKSPSNDWTAPTNQMYAAMHTIEVGGFQSRCIQDAVLDFKKQTGKECSSVSTWGMGQVGVVLAQCTFPCAWRRVQAQVGICIGIHRIAGNSA